MNASHQRPITTAALHRPAETADDACMSIGAISSIQQAQTQQEVAYAVARKALDQVKLQGDAALSLLQSAAEVQKTAQTQRPLGPGQTISVVA